MRAVFSPSFACGEVYAPPSKSMAHRDLISAALCEGESTLSPIALSEDMLATMSALEALGACFTREEGRVFVKGFGKNPSFGKEIFCRESGSTLRFLIPLCLLSGKEYILSGSERLMERPLSVYEDLAKEKGFLFEKREGKLFVAGRLSAGEYSVPGNISSQFITGLLFALSLLEGDSFLQVTGGMESASYIDMTLSAMADFGVNVEKREGGFFIPGGQKYLPRKFQVEGDYSNAAFLDAFSKVGGKVSLLGMKEDSLQGDRVYKEHFKALEKGFCEIDLSDCPDLAPILFALAAYFHGAHFTGTKRLRIKESDRGEAMRAELGKCGVTLEIGENDILVPGGKLLPPKEVIFGQNDHRIVMAMSVLLSCLGGEIEGAEAVAKSYPDFFEEIKKLGIKVDLK
ncbi:MAG: 3-phosphoshikimate 1-carboxyvinyltransferase [Clostridia bacterium]|nr:3-phosphoshikimate 1-carboxyvinyltransferase [Clostridia bacterium]